MTEAEAALDAEAEAAEDVAGTGEEDFEAGMRQNAMERDAADADNDGKLDLSEFMQFVRDREEGEFTDEELKKRFDALDEDGSGKIDMSEYLLWSLKDALSASWPCQAEPTSKARPRFKRESEAPGDAVCREIQAGVQEANAQRDGRKTHDATARLSQRPRGVITAVQGPRYGVAAL